MAQPPFRPEQVLDFWFPDEGQGHTVEQNRVFMTRRMQGGMDDAICRDFAGLTEAAARGELDDWAETPRGRLALLIALDQFPRSLWRGTPGAYAQDIKSTRLALEGLKNGDFDAVEPWEQVFYFIAISHCEGPDHLARMRMLGDVAERIIARLPQALEPLSELYRAQQARVLWVIERFGRHPHRNAILGRISTPEEEAYIAEGDFPHLPRPAAG